MTKHLGLAAVALAAVAVLAPAVFAEKKEVKPTQTFKGSVDDQTLAKDAPAVITSAKALEKLWKDWKIADKMPEIDFTKNVVVTTTSVGSQLNLTLSLDSDKGDLTVGGFGTKDLRPGFRYVIGVVPIDGVKTVNGKELPKE